MKDKVEDFLKFLEVEKNYSSQTLRAYKVDLLQFLEFLNQSKQTLQDVSPFNLKIYILELKKKGLKASSLTRKISALKSFFKFLSQRGEVNKAFFLKINTGRVRSPLPECL